MRPIYTRRFLRQTAERVATGAAIGASTAYGVGMSAWDVGAWSVIGNGAVWGGFLALCASLAGSTVGDRTSPLMTAKEDDR